MKVYHIYLSIDLNIKIENVRVRDILNKIIRTFIQNSANIICCIK